MNDEIDPILQTDLRSTDITTPILPKGNYKLEVVKAEQRTSENGTKMFSILAKTVETVQDVSGNPIPPGHLLSHTIFLKPSEFTSQRDIDVSLAKFMHAVSGAAGQLYPFEQWKGKVGTAKVAVDKANDRYPNKITGWVS